MSVLDFRLMIKNELAIRQERNPRYSLRAFSRDLSVSAPFLSQIINGARCPSERMANDIAQECKWSDSKTELFLRLVRFASCKDVSRKRQLAMDLSLDDQYQELQIGAFETVSNWIHFAILEMTQLASFKSDLKWIAKKLCVGNEEVSRAIRQLKKMDLLIEDNGVLKSVRNSFVPGGIPSEAIRSFHLSHLKKAVNAIVEQSYDKRHFSGMTTAINPAQIPVVEEMILKFQRKLAQVLEKGPKTSVYHLSFQLYQLDCGRAK